MSRVVQLVRYGGTAGVAALVDLAGFVLLYRVGLPVGFAAVLSFLVATIVNYGLTARFVFSAPVSLNGYLRFLAAALFGFCVNVGVTMALALGIGIAPILAKLAGIGIAFFANFALNAAFVFPARTASPKVRTRVPEAE